MAKSRKKSRTYTKSTVKRDTAAITNRRLFYPKVTKSFPYRSLPALDLSAVEDRRFFSPERPLARTITGNRTKIVAHSKFNWDYFIPSAVRFSLPGKVIECVRRKRRREVLMAKTGGGNIRKKQHNRMRSISEVICK